MDIFDRFILHQGVPAGPVNLDLVGEGYWIEPVISDHAAANLDEKLRPVLARKPLEQAANNVNQTLVYRHLFGLISTGRANA